MKKISITVAIIFSIFSFNTFSQSCSPFIINMYDSFGDGWNGNDLTFTDTNGTIFFSTTLNSGSSGTDSVCLPSGCFIVSCDGGSWQGEVSWDILDSTGGVVLSGGAPYSGYIGTCIFGCTDPNAVNFNPFAHINIGFCVYGCIQSDTSESFENGFGTTWIQDPNNSVDWTNISGTTPSFNTGPSSAFDGNFYIYTEASGSANSEAVIYVDCIDPTQWSQLSLVFAYHMFGSSMGTLSIDVSTDTGSTWIQEWSISGDQGNQWNQTFVDLSSYTNNISVRVQAETGNSFESDIAIDLLQFMEIPSIGCTNPLASNFDSTAVIDDGSCIFPTGCTNPLADNYDSTAVIDDSSCVFSNCTQLTLNMYDSFGDGWNGNDFIFTGSNGTVLFTTTLSSGSTGSYSFCAPFDCYTVSCDGGSWQGEVSWDLVDTNGIVIFSGGAPYLDTLCFPVVIGCTNPLATNYDSLANVDNGFCFFGCIEADTSESFENGLGITWLQSSNDDIDWINNSGGTPSFNTGPSSAYDGNFYMYTEASVSGIGYPNKEAIIYVSCIDPTKWTQLALVFSYHMYGTSMGDLSVDVSVDSGTTWVEEWTLSGNQGDQWNQAVVDLSAYSNNISVRIQAETGTSFTSDFAVDLLQFTEMPSIGCTNPLADNYDSTAVIDDGSCYFSNCTQLTLNMFDSFGDGWNGNDFTITSSNGNTFFTTTLSTGSSGSSFFCAPSDCYTITCDGGSWQGEVSWDLVDSNGVVILSGDAPYSGSLCIPTIVGCTNPLAINYDSTATIDDGSCFFGCIQVDTSESFESGLGITWVMDPNNDIDWTNRSGGTPSFGTGPSGAFDGSYYMYTEASGNGNGYPNKQASMYVPCVDPTQWSSLGIAFAYHMRGTSMGTLSIDVSPDSGTTWIQEWSLSGNQGNQWNEVYVDLSAYTSDISVRVKGITGNSWRSDIAVDLIRFLEMPVYGCTDPFANNFDSTAVYDDGSCTYVGCTDPYSINYCTYCNVNDSISCQYYSCKTTDYSENFESNNFSVVGWTNYSGSEAAVTLNNLNAIADTVSLRFEGGTGNSWGTYVTENQAYANVEHLASASLCLDLTNNNLSDTITLSFETVMFSSFITTPFSWLRVKVDGNVISDSYGNSSYNNTTLPYTFGGNTVLSYDLSAYSGGIHYITFECINKYGSSANNPATVNYVWVDNVNISLPLISGCTDSIALNYNISAQIDDGSCFYDIFGCTDSTALNYDPLATADDGSCIYTVFGCTDPLALNFSSIANTDDGSCIYCLYGCMDSLAFNYDPIATCDDGSCVQFVYGCTDSTALNYLPSANSDDGSCQFAGCTDSSALNYNPLATLDDGSCISATFGCTDSTAQNFNPLANIDDGSCIAGIFGCTDPIALNYFPGATYDDGSCIFAGCTDSTALNYDPQATIDDGSCVLCVYGCMDTIALNYNSSATCDDGSCQYQSNCTSPKPDGLYIFDLIDTRVKIGWNNMNSNDCMVLKYFVRYREVGTTSWTTKSAGVGNGLCIFGLNTTFKQLLNLTPSTNYEFKMKAFYCDGTSSNYSSSVQFTTKDQCPEMTNLSATTFSGNQAKVRFDWDTSGTYTFARILLRVDTPGSAWQTAGGFGVYYPNLFVNKFGLQPGESYRAQGRTFCDSNITAYRSPTWTSPIFWTQPGSTRNSGGVTIADLTVFPNPTRDIFSVSFVSDDIQDIQIRVINVLGNIIYKEEKQKFTGEYIKQIDINKFGKGIYFLEIETPDGIINKKLILH